MTELNQPLYRTPPPTPDNQMDQSIYCWPQADRLLFCLPEGDWYDRTQQGQNLPKQIILTGLSLDQIEPIRFSLIANLLTGSGAPEGAGSEGMPAQFILAQFERQTKPTKSRAKSAPAVFTATPICRV